MECDHAGVSVVAAAGNIGTRCCPLTCAARPRGLGLCRRPTSRSHRTPSHVGDRSSVSARRASPNTRRRVQDVDAGSCISAGQFGPRAQRGGHAAVNVDVTPARRAPAAGSAGASTLVHARRWEGAYASRPRPSTRTGPPRHSLGPSAYSGTSTAAQFLDRFRRAHTRQTVLTRILPTWVAAGGRAEDDRSLFNRPSRRRR